MKTIYDKDGNALGTFLEEGDATSGDGGSSGGNSNSVGGLYPNTILKTLADNFSAESGNVPGFKVADFKTYLSQYMDLDEPLQDMSDLTIRFRFTNVVYDSGSGTDNIEYASEYLSFSWDSSNPSSVYFASSNVDFGRTIEIDSSGLEANWSAVLDAIATASEYLPLGFWGQDENYNDILNSFMNTSLEQLEYSSNTPFFANLYGEIWNNGGDRSEETILDLAGFADLIETIEEPEEQGGSSSN